MKEALYYVKKENKVVECILCPHFCKIEDGNKGLCKNRINKDGILYSKNYGNISAINVDPMEKKPLYHFLPGNKILSVGTPFCNLSCKFCQNFRMSQFGGESKATTPEKLVKFCRKKEINAFAFTYTEPTVNYEFVLDAAKHLSSNNIKVILVTNGYINPEPLKELLPYVDALNIDLKSFTEDFYEKVCGAKLQPVLDTIKIAFETGSHIEITNLAIPEYNDSVKEFKELVKFVSKINKEIPLHISKYYPQYQLDADSTPTEILLDFFKIAKKKLTNVYLGNIHTGEYSHTYCPNCNTKIIERNTYKIKRLKLADASCDNCGTQIYGVFNR